MRLITCPKMDTKIWERVLIDWVNCLKLAKPIQRLEELRDGIFYNNLQKVIKKSPDIEMDVLTYIFHVLDRHYPKFKIQNKTNVHLNDISFNELVSITSLLMHYTCIHDRRDVLTSPLCYNLKQTTQLCIRNFLEKLQECSELTNEILNTIIKNCVQDKGSNSVDEGQYWLTLSNHLDLKQSPLQDILKTPTAKSSKLLEKDKEIGKLKTDLQLAQEEKENLEEDLRVQTEKNKKLEKQLNQRTAEISRLRSEVLALEDRTPPHYQDKNFRETQKILRVKVESLEQIIEQCDKENEELRNQREADRAQIKILESQYKTWLEKFIETDNKLQIISEHSKELETKNENLKAHCNELESLLEELRPRVNNDSFTEESFRSVNSNRRSKNFEAAPSCEDLAHSVVDIQLKEQQKENEELKISLKKAEDVECELKTQINELFVQLSSVKNEREELNKFLKDEKGKVEILSEKYEELKNNYEESAGTNKILFAEKIQLSKNLEELYNSFNTLQLNLSKVKQESEEFQYAVKKAASENQILNHERQTLEGELENSKKKNDALNMEINSINTQLTNLLSEKKLLIEGNHKLSENMKISMQECEDLKSNLKILESEIHKVIKERDQIVEEKNNSESSLKNINEKLVVALDLKSTELANVVDENKLLQKDINNITKEKMLMLQELQNRDENLNDLKHKYDLLDKEYAKIVNDNTLLLEKEQQMIQKLEKSTEVCRQFEIIEAQSRKDIELLTSDNHKFEKQKQKYEEEIQIYEAKTNILNLELDKLSEEFNQTLKEKENLAGDVCSLTESLKDAQTSCQEYQLALGESRKYSNAREEDISRLNNLILKNEAEYKKKIEDHEQQQVVLVNKVESLKTVVERKTIENEQIVKEKVQLQHNLTEANQKIIELECDINELISNTENKVETFNIKKNELNSKLSQLTEELNYALTEKNLSLAEIRELNEQLTLSQNEFHEMKLAFEDSQSNSKVLKDELARVILEKEELIKEKYRNNNLYVETSKKYEVLFLEMETFKSEYNQLSVRNKALTEENEKIYKENIEEQEQFKELSDSYESLKFEFEKSVCINKSLSEEKKTVQQNLEKVLTTCKEYEESLNKTNVNLTEFQSKFMEMETEKQILKQEMYELQEKLENRNMLVQNLTLQIESTNKELKDLVNIKSSLTKETCDLMETLKTHHTECENMKIALNDSEYKFKMAKEEMNKIILENQNLVEEKKQLLDLVDEKVHLQGQITELETNYKQVITKNRKIREITEENMARLEKLSGELENVISEKTILLNKLGEIINERDGLSDEIIKINSEKLKLLQEIEKLSIENDCLAENSKNVCNDLELANTEKQLLNQKSIQLSSDIEKILPENKKLSLDLQELSEKLSNKNKELTGVCQELECIKSENVQLFDTLNEITDFIENMFDEKQCSDYDNIEKFQKLIENERLKTKGVEQHDKKVWHRFLEVLLNCQNVFSNQKQIIQQSTEAIDKLNNDLGDKYLIQCQVQSITKENKELKETVKNVHSEKSELCNQLQILSEEKLQVLQELKSHKHKREQLVHENHELTKQVSTIANEKSQTDNVLQEKNEELKNLIKENERKEANLKDAIEKLNKLEEEKAVVSNFLDLNTTELQKVTEEKEKILEALEMSNKEVQYATQEIENLNEEKSNLQNQIDQLQNQLMKVNNEKINIAEQFERLSQEKAEFSEQLDKVSQDKADISEKLEVILKQSYEATDMLKKIDHLSEENAQLLGQITSIKNDLEAKTKEAQLLELTNKRLKTMADEKSEILDKVSNENKDIFEVVDRISQEKSEMSQSLELTLKELEKRSQEKAQLIETLNSMTKEIEKLSEDKQSLIESLEVTKQEVRKVKAERNELLETQTKTMKQAENNILLARESAMELKKDLLKRLELVELEKQSVKQQFENDIKKIREAYANVVSTNSKCELENVSLKKKNEDLNSELAKYMQIKQAYEKLLEENNKLMTEIDTVKYKRSRDREEFVSLLKKEREEAESKQNERIREVRCEYEVKLEKMKAKMLKLYREEVNKEMQKVKSGCDESNYLQKNLDDLRNQLFEAEQKNHILETERDMLRIKDVQLQRNMYSSRESLASLRDQQPAVRESISLLRSMNHDPQSHSKVPSNKLARKVHSVSSMNPPLERDCLRNRTDRKISTLPRGRVTEIEEMVTISRRTSINGVASNIGDLEMEDEDDDFNNKYLADLKAGKCNSKDISRDSNVNRFSELAWRNSLVPPHLKSSYPAEMQFISPTHFKEDDIKTGNIELDDSLCRLLPGEKPRQKKDFGTTSYKKPGPPTPSKNGGRLSLQGNEIRPLSDHNERTPKKPTPSRIKALFMGRTSLRENSENQCCTPKTNKRLSIFRKPK